MKILVEEKLSPHRYKTPEGYLICTDAILARTGKQDYMRRELFGDSCENPDEVVWVDRKPEEVFDESTLSSFENKPVTVEHPDEDVNPSNYKELAVGYVRDVKRDKLEDGTEVIKGNLIITDEQTIEEILNGEHTDLSCGYDCEILDEDNPQQRRIRGNHVALCEEGRAGVARIVDSKIEDKTYSFENIVDDVIDHGRSPIDSVGYNLKQHTFGPTTYDIASKLANWVEDRYNYDIRADVKQIGSTYYVYILGSKVVDSKVKDDDEFWFKMELESAIKENIDKFSSNISPQVANKVARRLGKNISYVKNDRGYAKKYTYVIVDSKMRDTTVYIDKDMISVNSLKNAATDFNLLYLEGYDQHEVSGPRDRINKLLRYLGFRENDVEIRDGEIKDASKYVYEFPYDDTTSEDKRMMQKYGLTVLGKSGKDRGEKNLAVMGNLNNLKKYCEEWIGGYKMHPDYLTKEENFIYDLYDSKKRTSFNDILKIVNIIDIYEKTKNSIEDSKKRDFKQLDNVKIEDADYDYKSILREALRKYNKSFSDLDDDNVYNNIRHYIENKYGKDAFNEVYNYLANYINKHGSFKDVAENKWIIKNTGLAYEIWHQGKMVKKLPTKRLAKEWIWSRFPSDKIIEDSIKDISVNPKEWFLFDINLRSRNYPRIHQLIKKDNNRIYYQTYVIEDWYGKLKLMKEGSITSANANRLSEVITVFNSADEAIKWLKRTLNILF